MKKLYVLLIVMVAMTLVVSCATSPAARMPAWVMEIAPQDVFWGIGSAKLENQQLAMQVAESRARRNAAEQIGSTVQGMLTDYANESGLASNPRSMIAIESIGRNLVNMELRGAVTNKREAMPDGTIWIRVAVRKADAMGGIQSTVRNEMADYAEFRADRALQQMEHSMNTTSARQVPPRTAD
jgi:hypothetical protein